MENEWEEGPQNAVKYSENEEDNFSKSELKFLNLIAELIVNISIRESYEKGN